jgi:hypothetical protein
MARIVCVLLIVMVLTAFAHPRQQPATDQDVVARARNAYYSLARKGFKGFSATIEPNWEVILAQSATSSTLKTFRAVRFSMVVAESGAVTVTHEVGADAASAEVVDRIHADIQRIVAGFFNTWRAFVVSSPFPETEKARIEDAGKQYRLVYTTEPSGVTITTTKEFLITEINISAPTFKRTVRPQFQKTVDGFLLTGYTQVSEPLSGGVKTTLEFHVEYQDLNGLKVPQKVRLSGLYGAEPVEAELVFIVKS